MVKVSWARAAAWRVGQHHLDRREPASRMLAVASRLCGVHAQVLSCAELSLWARVEGVERRMVQRALWEERTLVKTWAMRGTLHLLPAGELSLWHAALETNPRYLRPALWEKYFGITLDELDRLSEAVGNALDGRVLTREELVREVGRRSGSAAFGAKLALSSWGTVLKPAAFTGRLCFGPGTGQRVRFTHPYTWLKSERQAVDAQTATAEVTRRYLAAYGPATYHDLARWWGGGGVSTARQWVAALGEEVSEVDLEGTPAWMLAADARRLRASADPIRTAAAGVRPIRGGGIAPCRAAHAGRVALSCLPAAGLDFARPAGEWPHERNLASPDQGEVASGGNRALRQTAGLGAPGGGAGGGAAGGVLRLRFGAGVEKLK